jgi:hypothetical protein
VKRHVAVQLVVALAVAFGLAVAAQAGFWTPIP